MNSLTLNSSSISNAWREGGAMQRNAGTIGNNYLIIYNYFTTKLWKFYLTKQFWRQNWEPVVNLIFLFPKTVVYTILSSLEMKIREFFY